MRLFFFTRPRSRGRPVAKRVISICIAYMGHVGASGISICIAAEQAVATTPQHFLAHGWESFQASKALPYLSSPLLFKTFSLLRGQTVRIGGISADFFLYTNSTAVTDACDFRHKPFTPAGVQCPFSTGAFDSLVDFLEAA